MLRAWIGKLLPPEALAKIRAGLEISAFLSVYSGAWLAVVVAMLLGPPLMQLLQMMDGNLMPKVPSATFPMLPTVLAATGPVIIASTRRWRWATLACIPLLCLVGWQLYRMYQEAGVDPMYD